jgi:cell division protease FtsH
MDRGCRHGSRVVGFLVALTIWNAILLLPFGASTSAQIPYSEFVTQTKSGNVAAVTFNGQAITGTFRRPIVWPGASPNASSATSTSTNGSAPASYGQFATTMPPTGDPELLPLLQGQGVTVDATDTSSGGSLLWQLITLFATSVLPALLFIAFLFYLSKQMQRGQQGLLGFGGSKARIYDAQ